LSQRLTVYLRFDESLFESREHFTFMKFVKLFFFQIVFPRLIPPLELDLSLMMFPKPL